MSSTIAPIRLHITGEKSANLTELFVIDDFNSKNLHKPEAKIDKKSSTIFQIGLRDHGFSPFPQSANNLSVARRETIKTILIETSKKSHNSDFSEQPIVVNDLSNTDEIKKAIQSRGFQPGENDVFVPGSDAHLPAVFQISEHYQVAPAANNPNFKPFNKLEQRDLFLKHGVSQPGFRKVDATRLSEAQDAAAQIGYPVVAKFTELSDGRGVFLAKNPAQLSENISKITRLKSFDPNNPFISIEEYISHTGKKELGVQGVVHQGIVYAGSISEKLMTIDTPTGPLDEQRQFRESGHVAHTPDPENPHDKAVINLVSKALHTLDYKNGAFQADILGEKIIEVGARAGASFPVNDQVSPWGAITENTIDVCQGHAPKPVSPQNKMAGYLKKLDQTEYDRAKILQTNSGDLQVRIIESKIENDTENRRVLVTHTGNNAAKIEDALKQITAERGALGRS